jgi:pimeloyl-ACP methyl ester carboxylesterase
MTSTSPSQASADLAFGRSRTARALAAMLRAADHLAPELAARLALNLFFAPIPTKFAQRGRPSLSWRRQYIEVDGGRLAILRHESAQSALERPLVLLVHGWAGNADQMAPLGSALVQAGMDPVLLDLPAHGHSDGWRCTMPQIVAALFAVQHHLRPPHAIVAHSMGAVASLHAVACGLGAKRLVVMAPSSPPASVLHWFAEVFRLSRDMRGRMRQRIEAKEGMALNEFEAEWFGSRVNTPCLVIHDRADRMAPFGNSTTLVNELKCARLLPLTGSSHRRMLSDPRVIEASLSHLTAP